MQNFRHCQCLEKSTKVVFYLPKTQHIQFRRYSSITKSNARQHEVMTISSKTFKIYYYI